jgi:hypothetical protein
MARFLMNVMLALGGYPWTIIRVEARDQYLTALDRASIDMDIKPFAQFVAERVKWEMETKKTIDAVTLALYRDLLSAYTSIGRHAACSRIERGRSFQVRLTL